MEGTTPNNPEPNLFTKPKKIRKQQGNKQTSSSHQSITTSLPRHYRYPSIRIPKEMCNIWPNLYSCGCDVLVEHRCYPLLAGRKCDTEWESEAAELEFPCELCLQERERKAERVKSKGMKAALRAQLDGWKVQQERHMTEVRKWHETAAETAPKLGPDRGDGGGEQSGNENGNEGGSQDGSQNGNHGGIQSSSLGEKNAEESA